VPLVVSVLESEDFDSLILDAMQVKHLDDVMAIEAQAYTFSWTRSMFVSSLSSKDVCLILIADEKIIGYAIFNYIMDEAHLLNICISPDYQFMGLGRLLLRRIVLLSIENRSVMFFLEVRSSNTHAIDLYFSEGFNEVGVRPNYYPSEKGREDAILMTLDLSLDITV
jgi:ribosomal-protein-alanine N-acetyltransferase